MSIKIITDGKKVRYDVQVSARHPITGKREFLRRRADTKWSAQQLESDLRQELRARQSGIQVPSWSQLVAAYESQCLVNKAASTRHNELSIIAHHATPVLHSKLVNQITESDLRGIINNITSNRSLSLQHNVRKCLANVFNYAVECRYINENPCRRIKLQKVPEPSLNIL